MKEIKSVCAQVVYKKIYDLYSDGLYGFMLYKCGDSDKAEDFVQEAFVKLWTNCSKVIYEKAKSYLYTIANNLFLDDYAHQKVVLAHRKLGVKTSTNETPEYLIEEQEFLKKLQQAIANLPEKQREVFLMNRIDKKKYREIGEELNISIKAVEKRMTLALKTLRTQIKGI
ncbi:RNA polymerase sigma factor [Tenacibaculum amylolyticum]|uniref:RNA polymerase sigma factor n=1 Tax=Tenacibaculum amylolyticum TaxID=104269 RepID=UPI003893439D